MMTDASPPDSKPRSFPDSAVRIDLVSPEAVAYRRTARKGQI